MNTIGEYFLKKKDDPKTVDENIIAGKKYRISILTERLIRLEYSNDGKFEDRASQRVIFRNFPKVVFNASQSDLLIQVTTPYFTLNYVKEKPFSNGKLDNGNNLRINLNETDRMWYYGNPQVRNFGGIGYSLDDFNGNIKYEKGLYSTDGFAVLDDSDSLVLDSDGNFTPRNGNNIDIYVFMYKKDLGLCLQDYYTLTGYPLMIPRYALGNWWYKNERYTTKDLENLFNLFKEYSIPISSILLGETWHILGDPFNFDENLININDFKKISTEHNIKTGLTISPNAIVKEGTLTHQMLPPDIVTNGKFGFSFLPLDNRKLDFFTNNGIKKWLAAGIDNFYIDYNNVKDKKVLSLLNHYFYTTTELLTNKRGVILSRNYNYSSHRSQIIYNGKTKVDWNTLEALPRYQSTASNNGLSFVASPIGGFYGGIENFELYIRYIQLGVFSSMLILASDGGEYYKREPWRWNEAQAGIIKKYLTLRNKLIPYIYTESYIYHISGSPLIQPLYYKYPKIYDQPLYKNQYFFGSNMLVCPITKKKNPLMNRVVHRMFIPEGIWYELESGKKYIGNKYYMSFYKEEDYPVFCKNGSIIPLSLDMTTELPINMEIIIYPGSNGNYKLYEDDGITNNYKNGNFSITEYSFNYSPNTYEFNIRNTGNSGILPDNRNYKIRFKNTKVANVEVLSGNTNLQAELLLEKNDLIIVLNNIPTSRDLKINCSSNEELENSTIRLINDDIKGILEDLEIETILKEKIDKILFSDLTIKKKRIAIRKLKNQKLQPNFIKMFLKLLEYIDTV